MTDPARMEEFLNRLVIKSGSVPLEERAETARKIDEHLGYIMATLISSSILEYAEVFPGMDFTVDPQSFATGQIIAMLSVTLCAAMLADGMDPPDPDVLFDRSRRLFRDMVNAARASL